MDVTVKKEVAIANVARQTIRFQRVQSSCPCIVAKCGKTVLLPGETTTLEVDLRLSKPISDYAGRVFLFTTGASNETKMMELAVRAKAPGSGSRLVVVPRLIDFGDVAPGEVVRHAVKVRRTNDGGLANLSILRSADWIAVQNVRRTIDGLRFDVKATLPFPTQRIRESITIKGEQAADLVHVGLKARIVPKYEAQPGSWILPPEPELARIRIVQRYGEKKPFVVKRHEFTGTSLELVACGQAKDDNRVILFEVRRKKGTAGFTEGTLALYWQDGEQPTHLTVLAPPIP